MAADQPSMRGGVVAARLPSSLLGERALARLAARGEQRAFEEIFERYHQELHRYCRAIVGNAEDAQDALQSTMAAAMRALPERSDAVALRPWLYRVAHNEAISLVRARRGTGSLEDAPEQTDLPADICAEDRERLAQLVEDLRSLPDRHRSALVMREVSDLGYREIGAALSATDAAARQLVYEARNGLRELKLGREMECEVARQAISERDGRILRGRKLRAHLKSCEPCQDFFAAISRRRSDFQALTPALGPAAASAVLASVLGGSQGGLGATGAAAGAGGAVATGLGTTLAGSAAVKAASIAAVVTLGVGTANMSGVHVPLIGKDSSSSSSSTATEPAAAGSAHSHSAGAKGGSHSHAKSGSANASHGRSSSRAHGQGRHGPGNGPADHSNAGGNASAAGNGSAVAGTSGPAGSGNANLGNSGTTAAADNSQSPNHTGVEHTPPGSARPEDAQSAEHGNSSSAPGRTGEQDGNGNANANGHDKP